MLSHAPGAFPCLTFIVRQQLPLLSEQLRVTFCLVTKETVVILKRNTFLSLSGVCIHVGHRPQTDRVCRMSICFFSRHDKCPITFLSVRSLSIFFFFFVTLRHRKADPVTGCLPKTRTYIRTKNTAKAIYF